MNFADAVKSVLTTNYANFNGRARPSEFWWYALFNLIVAAVFTILIMIVPAIVYLDYLYLLAVLIPGIAVGVRRLHDLDKSGWWLLITVTLIGAFVLLYWFTQPGTPSSNKYGAPVA